MGAALEPPEIALAGVPKLRRAVTLFASRRKTGATSKQAKTRRRSCRRVLWPREVRSRLRVVGRPATSSPKSIPKPSPSGERRWQCRQVRAERSPSRPGDSRRTARATTAGYLLWRARGAALSFATGRRAILWGDHLFFAQLDTGTSPSSEGQHKCERSEALVGGDSRRTARATTAGYLLWRAKGAALSFATGRRAILWGRPARSLGWSLRIRTSWSSGQAIKDNQRRQREEAVFLNSLTT